MGYLASSSICLDLLPFASFCFSSTASLDSLNLSAPIFLVTFAFFLDCHHFPMSEPNQTQFTLYSHASGARFFSSYPSTTDV